MAILLDTNALIWILNSSSGDPLGESAKHTLSISDTVYVSSVSIFEIRIKSTLGKLHAPERLLESIRSAGLKTLPLSAEHADAIQQFPNLSGHDPFDRLLLAQAKTEGLTFLTSDRILLNLNLDFIVNARH